MVVRRGKGGNHGQARLTAALFMAMLLFACGSGWACSVITWYTYTAITGGNITSPANDSAWCIESEVNCSISTAYDRDSRWDPNGYPQWTYPYDSLTYTWSAGGGSWANGVNTGQSVIWIAPATPGEYTITCTISDLAEIPQGETGSRDDVDLQPMVRVTVVKAEIKAVTFTSDHGVMRDWDSNYPGSGGTVYSPRGWQKSPNVNNPVSHTKGLNILANVVVCVQPSGVSFDLEGRSSTGALSFSAPGQTSTGSDQTVAVTSAEALPAKVDTLDASISWTIRNLGGAECEAEESGPHTIYVTWEDPLESPLFDLALEKACGYANGKSVQSEIALAVCQGIDSDIRYDPAHNPGLDHELHLYDEGKGQCDHHAALMTCLMRTLGIQAKSPFVWGGCGASTADFYTYGLWTGPTMGFVGLAAHDAAPANPHFRHHVLVETAGGVYDPSYGKEGMTSPSEFAPAHNPFPAATLHTGDSFPTDGHVVYWTCPH